MLAKNLLQTQNKRIDFEFEVQFMERDIEKYDLNTLTYYLNNKAKVRPAVGGHPFYT
jgi:hypothetical protein